MVVRNVVRSPVRAVVQSVFGEGESFHPFQLFRSGAQGAWYDPSDFSTLYQDAAGTTPVTAVEQPVGLMLDRSKGLVLGSELVTNGDFSDGTTGWSVFGGTLSVSGLSNELTITNNGANYGEAYQLITTVAGKWYRITGTMRRGSVSDVNLRAETVLTAGDIIKIDSTSTTNVTITGYFQAQGATTIVGFAQTNITNGTGIYDNISVRELPGNHAVAPNDASRPVLRARYNLLTRTEEFDNAGWSKSDATITANAIAAPDGTLTADKITENSATSTHVAAQALTLAATPYTYSVFIKAAERTLAIISNQTNHAVGVNLLTGATTSLTGSPTNITSTQLANGWWRLAFTFTPSAGATNMNIYVADDISNWAERSYTGDGTSGIYIWGAQLLTAADHAATGGAYQRVGAATDYDTGPPWRPYLAFDGSDDSFSTSAIDFSGTDEMTVFAGVTKLSDAAQGTIVELSGDINNNGIFLAIAPQSANEYFWRSKGTSAASAIADSVTYAAPVTNVFTGIGDIGADKSILRLDGLQVDLASGDQGTGNFGNYPLFIGRRNNASNPFNGRFYSLAVLGRTATAAELSAMESWIAGKTGVSL